MSNALVWILTLLTCVLLVATCTARGERSRSRTARALWRIAGWLPPGFLLLWLLFVLSVATYFMPLAYRPFLVAVVAMSLLFGAAVVLIRLRAARLRDGAAAGTVWPAGRLAVATLISFALLLMTLWNMDLQSRLRIEGYRTQAATMIVSVAPARISDRNNAAIVYELAFARIRADESLRNSQVFDLRTDIKSHEAQEVLHRHEQTIQIIRQAADMPECRFEHNYAAPPLNMLLPELTHARSAANLLALAARHELASGQVDLALADIARLYAVSGHVQTTPALVSHMVGIGIRALAHRVLAQALPDVTSPKQLDDLWLPEPTLERQRGQLAIRVEGAFGISTMCDLASGQVELATVMGGVKGSSWSSQNASPGLRLALPLIRAFMFDRDIEGYVQLIGKAVAIVDRPYGETALQRAEMESFKSAHAARGLFSSILAPSLSRAMTTFALAEATGNAAQIAVAATRFRLANGRYPADLSELGISARDPFDGQDMRLKVSEEGLIIYSVGEDLKDDGGAIDPPTRKGPADVGLILRTRPATRPVVEE